MRRLRLAAVAVALSCAVLGPATAQGLPPCAAGAQGWCVALRIEGTLAQGELGFRFGEPLDTDGDGRADIAAGARFRSIRGGQSQEGEASVWSGATGKVLRHWDGTHYKGLFGHWTLPVPDLDGDGLADVLVAAPSAEIDHVTRGVVTARSPASGRILWTRIGDPKTKLGWDMAIAGDQNGDGHVDLFVGGPAAENGQVYLLNGGDGSILRTYSPPSGRQNFGWYVASAGDLDGDGHDDLIVGDPQGEPSHGGPTDQAHVFSGATATLLRSWSNPEGALSFGEVVTGLGDLDGDGRGEIVVTSSGSNDVEHALTGYVQVFSGSDYRELRRWEGKQGGEIYGRMAVSAGDIDGDGVEDLAVGAPWHAVGDAKRTGRVEIRSGKSGKVLAEWFGKAADDWFGWHIRRAPDPEGRGRPALLIGSLRRTVEEKRGVGVIDLYVLQDDPVGKAALAGRPLPRTD